MGQPLPAEAEWVAPSLRVETHDGHGEMVLALVGEADIATAAVLRQALTRASENGCDRIVLDLEALEFVDAHCLGLIASTRRSLAGAGAELVVRSLSPMVVRLLGILGWDGLIEPPRRSSPTG